MKKIYEIFYAEKPSKYFLIFPEPIILQNFRHFKHYRKVEGIVLFHLNLSVVEILSHFLYLYTISSQFLNVGGGGEGQHGRINKTGLQAEASSLPDSLRPLESTMLSLSLTMKEWEGQNDYLTGKQNKKILSVLGLWRTKYFYWLTGR